MTHHPAIGQIGIVAGGNSFVDKGIEWVTRSPYHHAVVCVSDTELVEAEPGGARRAPLHEYVGLVTWSNFDLTPEQAQASADWAIAHVGTPYNWLDDAAIGLSKILGHWLPTPIMKRLNSDAHLQCAQLAEFALERGAGIKVFPADHIPGSTYPGSFAPIFKAHGWL